MNSRITEHVGRMQDIHIPSAELRRSIYGAFRRGEVRPHPHQAQKMIDDHLATWTNFSNTVMPAELVGDLIKQHAEGAIAHTCENHDGELLLPSWTDQQGARFDTVEQRANATPKFTQAEVMAYLHWLRQNPEVLAALSSIQLLISGYITHVGRSFPDHAQDFQRFRLHWLTASNNGRMIAMALFCTSHGTQFDTAHVDRAFNFLHESQLFHIDIPPAPGVQGVPVIRFSCPVQGQLRAIMAKEQTLSHVIGLVSKSDHLGKFRSTLDPTIDKLQGIVGRGGHKAYTEEYVSGLNIQSF